MQARKQLVHPFDTLLKPIALGKNRPSPFSSTVIREKTRRPSGTIATASRMIFAVCQSVMSLPSNTTRPLEARGSPHKVPSSVVFPAPLAPIRVTISPVDVQTDVVQRLNLAVVGADFFKR